MRLSSPCLPLIGVFTTSNPIQSDPIALPNNLNERLMNHQCIIFLAFSDNITAGFTQLYPGFSSLSLRNSWALNDLVLAPEARGLSVGLQLMDRAKQLAEVTGACQIMLQTAADNMTAQGLYETLGYQRDNDFYVHTLALGEVS